mgnify:CR=1 FL=1
MLALYSLDNGRLTPCQAASAADGSSAAAPLDPALLARAAWVDLLEPTEEEELFVERELGVNIPTRERIFGLEMANRIIEEGDSIHAPAAILVGSTGDAPMLTTVYFILRGGVLITVRHSPVRGVDAFVAEASRPGGARFEDGYGIYVGLVGLLVDRLAEVLGQVGMALDAMTQHVFGEQNQFRGAQVKDFRRVLRRLGGRGDMLSKARESLLSLSRINAFLAASAASNPRRSALEGHFRSITGDIRALADHVNYLSGRISLLLDATTGLINLEQNSIIKIFSVASVVFLPPTLVASIYGMNFHRMPELGWPLGYPFAIGLMVLSAVLPYLFFKRKGWL